VKFEEWFAQAESDLRAAEALLAAGHWSQAIWLAEQSAEKAHKSLFFALGLRIGDQALKTYSHFVEKVTEELPSVFGRPIATARLIALSEQGKNCRYPGKPTGELAPCNHASFDQAAAEEAIETAAAVLRWAAERGVWAMAGHSTMAALAAAAGSP